MISPLFSKILCFYGRTAWFADVETIAVLLVVVLVPPSETCVSCPCSKQHSYGITSIKAAVFEIQKHWGNEQHGPSNQSEEASE